MIFNCGPLFQILRLKAVTVLRPESFLFVDGLAHLGIPTLTLMLCLRHVGTSSNLGFYCDILCHTLKMEGLPWSLAPSKNSADTFHLTGDQHGCWTFMSSVPDVPLHLVTCHTCITPLVLTCPPRPLSRPSFRCPVTVPQGQVHSRLPFPSRMLTHAHYLIQYASCWVTVSVRLGSCHRKLWLEVFLLVVLGTGY